MTLLDDRPSLRRTRTAFPLLTRVGGLPADVLDLVSQDTRNTLADFSVREQEAIAAGDVLVDGLFDVVPTLDDDVALRRRVLAGKRAVHKARPLTWTDEETTRISGLLSPSARSALEVYQEATERRDALRARLEGLVSSDREMALDRLHEAVLRPEFLDALVMAAPDWVRHAKPHERRATSIKDVKTLLSYVSRAAAKTSPFSGLTTVGVAGRPGEGRGSSRTSAELGVQALGLLAKDPATAGLLSYRTPVLRPGGTDEPSGLFLASELVSADGIVWREDRVMEADTVLPWSQLFDGLGSIGFDDLLGRLGGPDPFARFRRLLDSGTIRPLPPWQRHQDPLDVLATLVEQVTEGASPITASDLHLLADGGRSSADLPAGGRLRTADEMGRAAIHLAPERGTAHRPSGLVYEDRECGLDLVDPTDLPGVQEDLDCLARRIRPWVFRSHVYDLVVERFVAEFGPGGRTTDPLGFFMRMSVERDGDPDLRRAQANDQRARREPGARAWLPVGPTSAPPNVGAMFQIATPTADDGLPTDRNRLVVNNYGSGSGALFARFSSLLGTEFEDQLREGVNMLWRGRPTRELTLWTDCNTAQAQCSGVLPPLLVPGEPDASGGVRLDDVSLAHDPANGTLSLLDRSGEPFGLAYLGLTPRHLLSGYLRLLGVLADPWINASPDSDYALTKMDQIVPLCGAEVSVLPRLGEGTLVTRRASWIVPSGLFPGAEQTPSDADLLLAAKRFREEHGVPEEVFVQQIGGMGAPMSGQRKPMWASLSSPLSLRVLHQCLATDTTHLRVVEAMPTREQHTQRDADGRPVVTEHCVLMHWGTEQEEAR